MNKLFNKELESAGSSGSADAAPRMTEECGCSIPIYHCEGVARSNLSRDCFTAFAMTGERGRSMVETLATLAIMGILGVAGVAAYNSAMNRYRANTLINEAQKRAVVVAGQIGFNNQKPNLSEFEPYNKTSAGEFKDVTTEGIYKQFGIEVSGVTKPVCQNILNTIGDTTPIRRLSKAGTPTTPITSCEESNEFLFIYNDDMQGATSDTEYATDESSCKSVCGKFNPETHLCNESDCEIPTNTCTADDQCNSENECMVCDTTTQACKNGCERVGYLESTGEQYIDTGIVYQNDYNIESYFTCNTSVSGSKFLFGVYGNGNHRQCAFSTYKNWNTTSADAGFYYGVLPQQLENKAVNKVELKNKVWYYNDTAYGDAWDFDAFNNLTMYLFAGHTVTGTNPNYYFIGKMHSFKMYDTNNTLICDLIPVTSPKGNCMFDRVSKKLFCNAGSGTFEYGPK